jgi:glutathione peroxidase
MRTSRLTVATLSSVLALGSGGILLSTVGRAHADDKDQMQDDASVDSLYSLTVKTLEGKDCALSDYKGKVTLVVNVASKCGFTPQYTGLEKLYTELSDKGFSILGFPSNDFGGQEPGDAGEIRQFCDSKYSVTFPLFEKVVTKPGKDQSPVYKFLTKGRKAPSWNFCKYLVGKDGKVIDFYPSKVTPEDPDLRKAIDAALK